MYHRVGWVPWPYVRQAPIMPGMHPVPLPAAILSRVLLESCAGGTPPDLLLAWPNALGFAAFWGVWSLTLRATLAWRRRRHAADPDSLPPLCSAAGDWARTGLLVAVVVLLTLRFALLPLLLNFGAACR